MTSGNLIGIAAVLVLIAGPLLLGLAGVIHARRAPAAAGGDLVTPWNWKLTVLSALLYTLAFNLTFFIQEVFLVLPKAFTPGLRPTLFHNNHNWQGENELASLFQGTGVLATLFTGVICALLRRRAQNHSIGVRLFLLWMAYCGLFMALPQIVVGAIHSQSDVGMAMAYLQLGATTKAVAAMLALVAIPLVALRLRQPLLELAGDASALASARSLFTFKIATLPLLIAILLIIPFRMPREWIEVVMVPVVVTVIGVAWIQAGTWRIKEVKSVGRSITVPIAWPLGAVLFLLLIFQLLLRPGVRFY